MKVPATFPANHNDAGHYDGEDWTGRLLAGFERHPEYSRTEKVRIDILRRFGYYTTESNGHVSEVRALVPQTPGRDPPVDRPGILLDPRGDGWVPPGAGSDYGGERLNLQPWPAARV